MGRYRNKSSFINGKTQWKVHFTLEVETARPRRNGGSNFRIVTFTCQIENEATVDLSLLKNMLIQERANFYREIATAARKQFNFYVADLYLKLCLKVLLALPFLFTNRSIQRNFLSPFFTRWWNYTVQRHSILVPIRLSELKNMPEHSNLSRAKRWRSLCLYSVLKDESAIQQNPNFRRKYFTLQVNFSSLHSQFSRPLFTAIWRMIVANSRLQYWVHLKNTNCLVWILQLIIYFMHCGVKRTNASTKLLKYARTNYSNMNELHPTL